MGNTPVAARGKPKVNESGVTLPAKRFMRCVVKPTGIASSHYHRAIRRNSVSYAIEVAVQKVAQSNHPGRYRPAERFCDGSGSVRRTAGADDDSPIGGNGPCLAGVIPARKVAQSDHPIGRSPAKRLLTCP